jgi:hypothetical protein
VVPFGPSTTIASCRSEATKLAVQCEASRAPSPIMNGQYNIEAGCQVKSEA